MESVDAIAQKLIPCTCGGYGENKRRHMSDCPRHSVAWEDIAAALTAYGESVRTKFAAFADEKGEPIPVGLHRFEDDDEAVGFGWFHLERMSDGQIWMSLGASDNHLWISAKNPRGHVTFRAPDKLTFATKQAAEAAAGGKK